ncbi:MAG: hypothetical protein EPN53_13835 [Acidobacteria bacterium]|nr:MAG: hypothetical protein EPN53_13835 [Acidobacteriota bacterium]
MADTASSKGRAAGSGKAAGTRRRPAGPRRPAAPASERRRATPTEQLATELLSVQEALDGAVADFRARVSAQLAQVLRALQRPEPPSRRTVKDMMAKVRDVELTGKGRVKDLRRLRALAGDLIALLAEE